MPLSRRALLSAAAATGLALAGCGPGAGRPRATGRPLTLVLDTPFGLAPDLTAAYRAATGVTLNMLPVTGRVDGHALVPPDMVPLSGLLPLDDLLRTANLSAALVLPDTFAAFVSGGVQYGLPLGLDVLEVAVDPAAAAALKGGIPATWTPAELSAAIGGSCTPAPGLPGLGGFDFRHPWVWGAFLGQAADLVRGGRLALDDPTTRAGATALVSLVATHGWAGAGPVTQTGDATANPARFSFSAIGRDLSPAGRRRAPWPAVEDGTAMPGVVLGLGIDAACPHPEAVLALVGWLWQPAQQALLARDRFAPVVPAPGPWQAYFTALKAAGRPAWFDPTRFRNVLAGWPGGRVTWPGGGLVADPAAPAWAAVGAALERALATPDQLPALLAQAQTETNAAWAALSAAPAPPPPPARVPGTVVRAAFDAVPASGAAVAAPATAGCPG